MIHLPRVRMQIRLAPGVRMRVEEEDGSEQWYEPGECLTLPPVDAVRSVHAGEAEWVTRRGR